MDAEQLATWSPGEPAILKPLRGLGAVPGVCQGYRLHPLRVLPELFLSTVPEMPFMGVCFRFY
jgi:hypothetical protein